MYNRGTGSTLITGAIALAGVTGRLALGAVQHNTKQITRPESPRGSLSSWGE